MSCLYISLESDVSLVIALVRSLWRASGTDVSRWFEPSSFCASLLCGFCAWSGDWKMEDKSHLCFSGKSSAVAETLTTELPIANLSVIVLRRSQITA